MKKQPLLFAAMLLSLCISQTAKAQFEKGDILVNAGLSFGLIGYSWTGYGNSSFALPLNASVEFSINENFAVGPYIGYFSRSYSYSSTYRDRFSVISFGGRVTFHANDFLNDKLNMNIKTEKWDIYASAVLGYENYRWKYDSEYVGNRLAANAGRVIFGPVAGARYRASERFGLYAEIGRGTFGLISLGASLKL
jgi:hypothetical protein